MSIRDVEEVILGLRAAKDEWDKADLGYWREVDTRYTFVDPHDPSSGLERLRPKGMLPRILPRQLRR